MSCASGWNGAYTRIYQDAQPSSRTKDLVDLVLISELASLDAASLKRLPMSGSTSPYPVSGACVT